MDEFPNRYLVALNEADFEEGLALFTSDAIVISPLYGQVPVDPYFDRLLTDSRRASATLRRSFRAEDGALALHLACHWTFATGQEFHFDRIDVFDAFIDGRAGRLTLLYDTAPFRAEFAWARSAATNERSSE